MRKLLVMVVLAAALVMTIGTGCGGGHLIKGAKAMGKDDDRAINEFTKEIEGVSSNHMRAMAYLYRGALYSEKGEYDSAIADYNGVMRNNKKMAKEPSTYVLRGSAYAKKGEYETAMEDFDKAFKMSPGYPSAYYHRGIAYLDKKDYAEAISDFEAFLRTKPNNKDAKEKLEKAKAGMNGLASAGTAPVKMDVEEVALVASPQDQIPSINDIEIRAEARWMVLVISSSGPIVQDGSSARIEKYQELRVTINNVRSGLGPAATFNLPEGLSARDITLTETANGVSLVVRMRGMVNGPVEIRSGNNQVGILLTKDAQPEMVWSITKDKALSAQAVQPTLPVPTQQPTVLTQSGDNSNPYASVPVAKSTTYSTFTDQRNGKEYSIQRIGSRTWFLQDVEYGGKSRFAWNEARSICPSGWRLPCNADWNSLKSEGGVTAIKDFSRSSMTMIKDDMDLYLWWGTSEVGKNKSVRWYTTPNGSLWKQNPIDNIFNVDKINEYPVRCVQDN